MAIPKKLKNELAYDDFYKFCIRRLEGSCSGRITWEHSLIYAGKQIQEKFAIVPLCEYHHSIGKHMEDGDLKKDFGQWIAISRMNEQDKKKYSKRNWDKDLNILDKKYSNIDKYAIIQLMKLTEKEIQKQILDYLKTKNIFHYRQNSGGFMRNGKYYRFCSITGVSDIVCIVNGRYIGIEVKKEGGEQSENQKIFQQKLEDSGGKYVLAKSLDDVIKNI